MKTPSGTLRGMRPKEKVMLLSRDSIVSGPSLRALHRVDNSNVHCKHTMQQVLTCVHTQHTSAGARGVGQAFERTMEWGRRFA